MYKRICLSVIIMALAAMLAPLPTSADAVVLRIGQHSMNTQFPLREVDTTKQGFTLTSTNYSISSLFPSSSKKGGNLADLPDIVPVYAGFYDNDLAYYVDKDLLEPLDSFFTEIGLKPEDVIPASLLPSVTYKGHIWALPHRMDCFVLTYPEPLINRLGIKKDFDCLKAAMDVAERISKEAFEGKQVQSLYADLPNESNDVFCMWIGRALEPSLMSANALTDLIFDYVARGVFAFVDYNPPSLGECGIFLEQAQTVSYYANRRLIVMPDKVLPDDAAPYPNPVFLESFALKKNTADMITAGHHFLSWLLDFKTQEAIIKSKQSRFPYRHVPVLKPIIEHEGFKELLVTLPDLVEFTGLLERPNITAAEPPTFQAQQEAIAQRREEASNMAHVDRYVYLMNPIEFEAPEPVEKTETGSFDEY
jgi:hypothetical protein